MNRRSLFAASVFGGLAAVSALTAAVSHAALRELNETRRGAGEIVWRTGSDRLETASLRLRPDGRAEVRLEGRQHHTFSGRWRETRPGAIGLDLEGDFGRHRAQADGTLYLRGGSVDRLDIRGNADSGVFTARFVATGGVRPTTPPAGSRPGWDDGRGDRGTTDGYRGRPLAVNQAGTGSITMDGRRFDSLERATLDLDRDGTAWVRFLGRRDRHSFVGRWESRGGGSEDVRLVLDGNFHGERVRLEGTANLRLRSGGDQIDRVELRGLAGEEWAQLRFEAL
ncbi:MAG TPA: hypothetical protein VM490_10995 [Armatimonadaceae bacterium]|nr:hypothetical protein [Armatimonadaceae bacterium]